MTSFHWTCISASRAFDSRGDSNVERMEELVGQELTWYIPERDVMDYKSAGATSIVNSGGLIDSRNKAIHDAMEMGKPCVQLSDDLMKIERKIWGQQTGKPEPYTATEAAEEIYLNMQGLGAHLGGVAPTSNVFYSSDNVKLRHFVVGDFIIVSDTMLRFDPNMSLKEDYDYTCQHIQQYGLIARCDMILATFKHRGNAGGAVDYRTVEKERDNIRYLMKKWNRKFKINKNRGDGTEVIFKW